MKTYLCSHPSACDATKRDGLQPRERCANGHAPCWWEPVPFRPTPEILAVDRRLGVEIEQIKRCIDVAWGEDAIDRDERSRLTRWLDRAVAALERIEAIDENGYDPITDTGAPR